MRFFVGLHQPSDARRFEHACISVNRLLGRVSDFEVNDWILDSGAFTEISTHGRYRHGPEIYAASIRRWSRCGRLLAAVSQDFMCEEHILDKTGLSVLEHQRLTIERFEALGALDVGTYVMPVIQGFQPAEYDRHLVAYGDRLPFGAWVGVGSVCKRNGSVREIEEVLLTIHHRRPDLRLHGFGLKLTSLRSGLVRELLWSSDSMAWSWAARRQGRNANSWKEAAAFVASIDAQAVQRPLFIPARRIHVKAT